MSSVKLVNVSKKFEQQPILQGINLDIEAGEFVAVIGSSGCGKSTLLRLVAGLDTVSSGQILINNQCVNSIPPAERDMAMVFQSYALYPHMSVFDNMAYALKMRGMKSAEIRQRVDEVAEMLQLSALLNRKPKELSGGQRQRVAMGRAIVRSPAVFLFDEPLSNLDTKLRAEMRYEIKRLHQRLQTTSLYVTHDQTEAMTMASRVLVLNQGNIEQMATPETLYRKPSSLFVAGFTGHYPLNLIPAIINLQRQCLITELNETTLPLPAMNTTVNCGDKVLLGIRAEHLDLASELTSDSIKVKVDLIDDIGSDKLVQVNTLCGSMRFSIRTSADTPIHHETMGLRLQLNKVNVFDQKTGLRLGGWHE